MKIDARTSYPLPDMQIRHSAPTSFAATLAATQSQSPAQGHDRADFSSMTRQEMRNWVNTQIRNGEMSLDDSRPFMAMTMQVPVAGGLAPESDAMRYDFTQKVRDGIDGARARNDQTTLQMLESAIAMMLHHQGRTIGTYTRG